MQYVARKKDKQKQQKYTSKKAS